MRTFTAGGGGGGGGRVVVGGGGGGGRNGGGFESGQRERFVYFCLWGHRYYYR